MASPWEEKIWKIDTLKNLEYSESQRRFQTMVAVSIGQENVEDPPPSMYAFVPVTPNWFVRLTRYNILISDQQHFLLDILNFRIAVEARQGDVVNIYIYF